MKNKLGGFQGTGWGKRFVVMIAAERILIYCFKESLSVNAPKLTWQRHWNQVDRLTPGRARGNILAVILVAEGVLM